MISIRKSNSVEGYKFFTQHQHAFMPRVIYVAHMECIGNASTAPLPGTVVRGMTLFLWSKTRPSPDLKAWLWREFIYYSHL